MIPTLRVEAIDLALIGAYPPFCLLKDDTLSVLLLFSLSGFIVVHFRIGSTLEGMLLLRVVWHGVVYVKRRTKRKDRIMHAKGKNHIPRRTGRRMSLGELKENDWTMLSRS
ncbi:hypothetical protein K445DRAFT_263417 [Daldinia sp. EC12]|nr:hypothetical protein K445DRAFT_263417 [Daldinia sp. EC12]